MCPWCSPTILQVHSSNLFSPNLLPTCLLHIHLPLSTPPNCSSITGQYTALPQTMQPRKKLAEKQPISRPNINFPEEFSFLNNATFSQQTSPSEGQGSSHGRDADFKTIHYANSSFIAAELKAGIPGMQIKILGEQQPVSAWWHLLTWVTHSTDPAGSSFWWSFKLQDEIGQQPPLVTPWALQDQQNLQLEVLPVLQILPYPYWSWSCTRHKMPELSKAEIQ